MPLTADFSVVDSYHVMCTDGSAEKFTRPSLHAWVAWLNVNAPCCRLRKWGRPMEETGIGSGSVGTHVTHVLHGFCRKNQMNGDF